jgi:hypothetical protein
MENCVASVRCHARGQVWSLLAVLAVLGPACATGDSSANDGLLPKGNGSPTRDASISADDAASSGSSSGSGLNGGSDDASGTTTTTTGGDDATLQSDVDNIIPDDATGGDDGSGDDASGGDGGSVVVPNEAAAPPTYACVTTLAAPLPVCDSSHKYCLCTQDAQCNSNGMSNGGCKSGKCSNSQCSGGQFTDSAGCSVVGPTCNIGQCPSGTKCEGGPSSGWNSSSKKSLCGTSFQCCWCTSDSACPASGKCINDSTQNNCNGAGPCTGSGANFDGMHCELASPGIPMCSMQ